LLDAYLRMFVFPVERQAAESYGINESLDLLQ
jgi:hypothetical protein